MIKNRTTVLYGHSHEGGNDRVLQIALLLLSLLVSWSNLVFASDAELLFEAGNKAYLDGDWDAALEKWKQVEQRGYAGGALFYNLGNAFYKKGELGEAILYWERAARLLGEEGDVASNLKIARARITDKLDESVHLPVWDWFDRLRNRFSAGFVAWGSVLLSFALFGALSMKRWVIRGGVWNQRLKSVVWVTAALLIIGLSQAVMKARDESLRREGVLVSVEAEVLSAPALGSGKLLFTLHEGTKVRVLRKLEGWIEINAGKDKQGWVKDDAIGVI